MERDEITQMVTEIADEIYNKPNIKLSKSSAKTLAYTEKLLVEILCRINK
ncbi:MAG: hypothetical protein ACI4VF_09160 [Lachnospirales bacterium]